MSHPCCAHDVETDYHVYWDWFTAHFCLKTLDTIGNWGRPVFLTWCVSTYAQNNKPVNSIGRWSCKIIMEEKTPLSHEFLFRCLILRPQTPILTSQNLIRRKITSFLKTMLLQREPFLTMFQHLSIACYQVNFCANNYFEKLPIVSLILGRQFFVTPFSP